MWPWWNWVHTHAVRASISRRPLISAIDPLCNDAVQRVHTQWPWQPWCLLNVTSSPLPSPAPRARSGRRAAQLVGAGASETSGCKREHTSPWHWLELETVLIQPNANKHYHCQRLELLPVWRRHSQCSTEDVRVKLTMSLHSHTLISKGLFLKEISRFHFLIIGILYFLIVVWKSGLWVPFWNEKEDHPVLLTDY